MDRGFALLRAGQVSVGCLPGDPRQHRGVGRTRPFPARNYPFGWRTCLGVNGCGSGCSDAGPSVLRAPRQYLSGTQRNGWSGST